MGEKIRLKIVHLDAWVFFLAFFLIGIFGAYAYLRNLDAVPPLTELSSWKWVKVEKPMPEIAIKNYTDEKHNFAFDYPETLNLYRVANEEDLRSTVEAGERVPYLKVFLEETNGPDYRAQSAQEELFRSFLSFLPPFSGFGKPQKMVGYNVVVTAARKWFSEGLLVLTERTKETLCAAVKEGETVSVTDVRIAGEPSRKITCGTKTTSTLVLDPTDGHRYLLITGTVTTTDPIRLEAFEKAYSQVISSFTFLSNQ